VGVSVVEAWDRDRLDNGARGGVGRRSRIRSYNGARFIWISFFLTCFAVSTKGTREKACRVGGRVVRT
jgi:hypothetical protein